MLKQLTQIFGVSGYEHKVRDLIQEEIRPYADSLMTDALGNLIFLKKGYSKNPKRILFTAHMDEIGLQVIKIEDNGHIMVKNMGFLWLQASYMQRVRFQNGVEGLLTSKVPIETIKEGDFSKMYVDIGTDTKTETLEHVKVGDVAVFVGEYVELPGNRILSKSLDDRLGCYMLIEAIKKLKKPVHDLYMVFTVQEELGCRGAVVASERIKPDLAISVDITPAHDYPCDLEGSNTLGAGVAIKISDPSVICDIEVVQDLLDCCKENDITCQRDVIYRGGTEAGVMNLSHYGLKTGGISVATRNPHSTSCMVQMSDVDAGISLICHFAERPMTYLNRQD